MDGVTVLRCLPDGVLGRFYGISVLPIRARQGGFIQTGTYRVAFPIWGIWKVPQHPNTVKPKHRKTLIPIIH